MRILITGEAGFIGSHHSERMLKEGYEIVCLITSLSVKFAMSMIRWKE